MSSQATTFVGRSGELATLREAFRRARGGSGGVVLIAGEPGIGKTRLAQVFASEAGAAGAAVLWGRCYEGLWSPALAPWAEAVGTFVRAADPTAMVAEAGATGDTTMTPLARLVPELAPLVTELPALATLSAEQERLRLYDAVTRLLLGTAAQRPVVVFLDDLQWADQSSVELLRHLIYFAPRSALLIVATYRDGDGEGAGQLGPLLATLRRDPAVRRIDLTGLRAGEVATLVAGPGAAGNGRLAETIHDQTNGNPFFVEELLRHLVDEVQRVGEPLASSALTGELSVPEGIRLVVERRVERLQPAARLMLTSASVFESGFNFAVLPPLTGLAEEQLLDAIDEAIAARMIEPLPGGAERYGFVHAIVRQSLQELWNPSRRVRLHRRAAEALVAANVGREFDVAAELAIQYSRSDSLPGAEAGVPYALAAAQEAKARHARDQTAAFYRIARAIASGADASTRGQIAAQLAVAEAEIVEVGAALAATDEAVTLLERAGEIPVAIAQLLGDVARALKYSAYADERSWRPLVEQGLRLTSPEDGRTWSRLRMTLDPVEPIVRVGIRVGRWVGFDEDAVAIMRAGGDEDDDARTVESFDAVTLEETERYLARSRGWRSPSAIMYAQTVAANHFQYRHGAFRDAERLWRQLDDLSGRSGAIHWQQQATNQLTYLLVASGRLAEAREMEARANALAERLGPGQHREAHQLEMATALAIYQGGEWAEIGRGWRAMIDDPAFGPHDLGTLTTTYYAGLAAYAFAEAGDVRSARGLLDLLTPILEQMRPEDCNHNGAVAFAAGAIWRLGLVDLAPVYRQLAIDLCRSAIGDYPQSSNELTLARMAALMGRDAEATEAFAMARAILTASGQAPLLAIVDLDEAQMLTRRRDPAAYPRVRALLDGAREALEGVEMLPWLTRQAELSAEAEATLAGRLRLPGGLTEREAEVLGLVAKGHSDRQIGDDLFVSPRTVNAHVRNMLMKAEVANRVELTRWAMDQGIVTS